MTVSKPFLLGIFVFGMLLGGGASYFAFATWGSPRVAQEAPPPKGNAQKKRKKMSSNSSGGESLATLSPQEASLELASRVQTAVSEEDHGRLRELVSKAAAWSAESTMEQVMLIENPYRRREALKRLFNYWIGSDQEAALRTIKGIGNVALQRELYQEAIRWLSNDDPQAALGILEREHNLHDQELWSRSFARWARTDREEAVKSVLKIENAGLREQVLKSVARQLAETDLAKALEWAGTLRDGHDEIALSGVLSQAASSHPEAVIAHLEKIPAGRTRNEIIGRTADEWAERDPGAALLWAETLGEDEQMLAIGEIAERVFETDPDRAEEIMNLVPDSEKRRELVQNIARLRTTVDVEEAISWLDGLPAEDRAHAWSGVAREWARIDPQAAAAYAATVEDAKAQEELISAASYSWSQRDPAEAAEWAQSLEGRTQANAMYRIVENWSRDQPENAGEFVANALEGELQANMIRQVAGRWLRKNTAEASAWIDSLPDGQGRDSAVYTLIDSIENEFPETALQWANTIGDERKRDYVLRRITKRLEK